MDKPDNSWLYSSHFMTCSDSKNVASNESKKSMNNSLGLSLILVSPINVLERVHIRKFPIYDPFMTHLWRPYFISTSHSRYHSPSKHKLYISGGYMVD